MSNVSTARPGAVSVNSSVAPNHRATRGKPANAQRNLSGRQQQYRLTRGDQQLWLAQYPYEPYRPRPLPS